MSNWLRLKIREEISCKSVFVMPVRAQLWMWLQRDKDESDHSEAVRAASVHLNITTGISHSACQQNGAAAAAAAVVLF